MKSQRIHRLVMAASGLALTLTMSFPLGAQTLVQELRALEDAHPQIQSKQKSLSSAGEGIRAARAGYLPTVRATGDSGPEYVDNPTRRETQKEPYYRGRETAGLVVTQHLFDGYLTNSTVEAAKITKDMGASDLRATRQNVYLEGTMAYLDVLRQSRLIQLARDNERKVQEQLNLEDERVQKGAGMAADVLAAKQRLQVAKERRVNYEGNLEAAIAKYAQVFGIAPDVGKMSDPPVPAALIPKELNEALETAQKDNPMLDTAEKTIELTSERQRTAEAGYYPSVDLVGKTNYENDKNALIGVRRDWSLLLTVSWELFSGFKTDALVAQASFDHAAAKDNHSYASRKISETVRIAWHRLRTARERISLLENAAVMAEEVWDAQKKRREAGKATVQDVLDEETRVNDARINLTSAYFDMIQYSYELLAAMGRLEVDAIEANPGKAANGAAQTVPLKTAASAKPEAKR